MAVDGNSWRGRWGSCGPPCPRQATCWVGLGRVVEALGALVVVTAELVSTGWSWPTVRSRWRSCGGR
jgi:hypothetical protein